MSAKTDVSNFEGVPHRTRREALAIESGDSSEKDIRVGNPG